MAVLYISDMIGQEICEKFIYQFNKIPKDEEITVYINSEGGETGHADMFVNMLSAEGHRITLIACGQICSAAFNIFYNTECSKKSIHEDTIGMIHLAYINVNLNEAGKLTTEEDRELLRVHKASRENTLQKLKSLGLTPTELNKVKKGKDVYFTTERLKQLLNG